MTPTPSLSADVLIIGGGPAGLAAALSLSRQLFRTVIFDSGAYRNSRSKHMHTVPTWDHHDSVEYRASARKELLTRYETNEIVERKVETLEKLESGHFQATDATGQQWTGKKLILANGVRDLYPDIEGYDDCWGRSVFHCLFCHGYEERGSDRAGLLAVDFMAQKQMAMTVGCMAKNLAKNVTVYTNGNTEFASEIKEGASAQNLDIDTRKVAKLQHVDNGSTGVRVKVHFEDGDADKLGFIAHTPRTEPSTPWHTQLGLETTPTGDFKVNQSFGESSNVSGVYAIGDTGNMFKAVTIAIYSAGAAAAGIASSLSQGR
ncbi:MAG: hypothetical protein M1828_005108 [Chrysothrix sp. TS-e1954]|nr:MAG: hypothetical protein M1828_005108 [Chrysothrix sp. TS-e1954]